MTQPRLFHLQRDTDITGISGTGIVAHGVQWPDHTVTIRWTGDQPSTVNWSHLNDAIAVHGHGGHTRIIWADNPSPDLAEDHLGHRLAETHRPKFDPDPCVPAGVTRYLAYCPACSPNLHKLWRPGDPIPTCKLWDAAVAAGLTDPEHGPAA